MWSGSSRFQPGEGPSRGLLRAYELSDGTFSSTNHYYAPSTQHLANRSLLVGQMLEMTRNSISPSFNTLPAPATHSCMGPTQLRLAVTCRILTVLARSGYLLSAIPGVRGSHAFYSNVYLMTSLNRIQISFYTIHICSLTTSLFRCMKLVSL